MAVQSDVSAPAVPFVLPAVPADQVDAPVAAWREGVDIETYEPEAPDRYPMFLETRVYQGSAGKVYPLPFYDRISHERRPRRWDAVHLENRWLRLMILPELGGRIHVGLDRSTGYDFFYRNNVIKPALVGLAGPWISGGVEFNWPQHHRPATYLPVDIEIERHTDGAVTVWCSDHEPFHRMKGMHGITLHPDRAVVELRARLYNRTEDVQTFLWWANVAAAVHDDYQSFFPADVRVVADHAKRATTTFPRADGRYYGVDYPARVTADDPDADRLDWYRNIPVPTSYMCVGSTGDFFGGYDHRARAGFVHWADHRIAPGKKQWTWGNAEFGHAWDRNLTDGDGPYVELMAGVYTDNQPDFSFLAPGETKAFSQFWYPIAGIGPAHAATVDAAVHLDLDTDGSARVGVAVTASHLGAVVRLATADGDVLWSEQADVAPDAPLHRVVHLPAGTGRADLVLTVEYDGRTLVRWAAPAESPVEAVAPATEPPAPAGIASADELYLTGLHLAQYHHATRSPEPYWEEALRRDPGDARCNTALGARAYERGEFDLAEARFRVAIGRLTARNPNPYDGEPHYRLGLALRRLGRADEAYDAFAKAAWNSAWRVPSYVAMAQHQCAVQDWRQALRLLDDALVLGTDHLLARDLRALALRRLGRDDEAAACLRETLAVDPLDWWARDLAGQALTCDAHTRLDVALLYAEAGLMDEALRVVGGAVEAARIERFGGAEPIAHYHRAVLLARSGRDDEASAARRDAAAADATYCFPHRLEDAAALRAALLVDPAGRRGGRAAALLGHWCYDRRRYREAIALWRLAVEADPSDAVCWRNLGIAVHNVLHDGTTAMDCYDRAVSASPDDARLRYERDQLAKRVGQSPVRRLGDLERRTDLVLTRDDLTIELVTLLLDAGELERAVDLLAQRTFQPWEGGEGRALAAWERGHLLLARAALSSRDAMTAESLVTGALAPPTSLGEGPHLLANRSDLELALGDALAAQGKQLEASRSWHSAATFEGDFQDMATRPYSEKTYYSALAWQRLGAPEESEALLDGLAAYARDLASTPATIDYFATSLPALLLFTDDEDARRRTTAEFLSAQVAAARGEIATALSGLADVLKQDPNHVGAHDLRRELVDTTGEDAR